MDEYDVRWRAAREAANADSVSRKPNPVSIRILIWTIAK